MRDLVARIGARTKFLRQASDQFGISTGWSSSGEPDSASSTKPDASPLNAKSNADSSDRDGLVFTKTTSKLSERGPADTINLEDLQLPRLDQLKTVASKAVPPILTVQRPTPPTVEEEEGDGETEGTDRETQLRSSARLVSLTPDSPQSPSINPPSQEAVEPHPSNDSQDPYKTEQSPSARDYFGDAVSTHVAYNMPKKIWVKRSGASATLVSINEGDLVDDVRDMILKKYANSLGRSFDSPDVSLRIIPRGDSPKTTDRMLGPEESMLKTLETYFPGGQTVEEALIIDVPRRNTPRPSPGLAGYGVHMPRFSEDHRPLENGNEYFPPMPVPATLSPGLHSTNSQDSRHSHHHAPTSNPHAISILETGQIAPLPSPRGKSHRPKYPRHNTASPTVLSGATASLPAMSLHHQPRQGRIRHDSSLSEQKHPNHTSAPQPLPTPPAGENGPSFGGRLSGPSTPRVASPRPTKTRKSRKQANGNDPPPAGQSSYSAIPGIVDGSVPPINVLIVEDNPINLRLLEAFVKRLKVRWATAMNGRDAVLKWRGGGFHLVLMDIQLPIMSGLEATKEIRRLERVNGIGVFARSEDEEASSTPTPEAGKDDADKAAETTDAQSDADKLQLDGLLKSPVIIVALTASSLQSDRHEALAAGCNDFLTKPVSFPWFERKVMEWGCMQALIDFDGWRKWKDFAANAKEADGKKGDKKEGKSTEDRAKRMSLKSSAVNSTSTTNAITSSS